jgi:hypothetical protein
VSLAQALSARLKAPTDCSDAAQLVAHWHGEALRALELNEETLLMMLMASDVLRRPHRLRWLIDAVIVDASVRDWAGQGSEVRNQASEKHHLSRSREAAKEENPRPALVLPPSCPRLAPFPKGEPPRVTGVCWGATEGGEDLPLFPSAARFLEGAADALQNVDAAAIARDHAHDPSTIPAVLHAARIEALTKFKRAFT